MKPRNSGEQETLLKDAVYQLAQKGSVSIHYTHSPGVRVHFMPHTPANHFDTNKLPKIKGFSSVAVGATGFVFEGI